MGAQVHMSDTGGRYTADITFTVFGGTAAERSAKLDEIQKRLEFSHQLNDHVFKPYRIGDQIRCGSSRSWDFLVTGRPSSYLHTRSLVYGDVNATLELERRRGQEAAGALGVGMPGAPF